jgi:hypothetical protein
MASSTCCGNPAGKSFWTEAMTAGVPVVAPAHGAFPEMLATDAAGDAPGILHVPRDPADLARPASAIHRGCLPDRCPPHTLVSHTVVSLRHGHLRPSATRPSAIRLLSVWPRPCRVHATRSSLPPPFLRMGGHSSERARVVKERIAPAAHARMHSCQRDRKKAVRRRMIFFASGASIVETAAAW